MALTAFISQQTLPEVCSEQDEMDFLMEALIIRYSLRDFYSWWAGGKRVMQVNIESFIPLPVFRKEVQSYFSPDGILVGYKALFIYLKQDKWGSFVACLWCFNASRQLGCTKQRDGEENQKDKKARGWDKNSLMD